MKKQRAPEASIWRLPRLWCSFYMLVLVNLMSMHQNAFAQDEEANAKPSYAYLAIEPDVITNFVGDNSGKLGYLRMTIEIMIDDPSNIPDVEHHMPLLRSIVIEVVGAQNAETVKSLTGREEIRRTILKRFKDVLLRETGEETVRDIIFTKYLRQGG